MCTDLLGKQHHEIPEKASASDVTILRNFGLSPQTLSPLPVDVQVLAYFPELCLLGTKANLCWPI